MELPNVLWLTPAVDLLLAKTLVELDGLGLRQQLVGASITPAAARALARSRHCSHAAVGMGYSGQLKAIRAALQDDARPLVIHAVGMRSVAFAALLGRGGNTPLVGEYSGERWRPWHGWVQGGGALSGPDIVLVRDAHCLSCARQHLPAVGARLRYIPRAIPAEYFPQPPHDHPLPLIGLDLDAVTWAEAAFFLQTLQWLPDAAPCQLLLLGSCRARARARRVLKLYPAEVQRRIRFARTDDEPDKNWLRCVASLHTLSQATSGSCLLQAMACMAAPVVVADCKTALVEEGKTGINCAPRNPYALSQRLQALCEELDAVRDIGARARARVLAEHGVADAARALLDLYAESVAVQRCPMAGNR